MVKSYWWPRQFFQVSRARTNLFVKQLAFNEIRGTKDVPIISKYEKYLIDTVFRIGHGEVLTFQELEAWENKSGIIHTLSEAELIIDLSHLYFNNITSYARDDKKEQVAPMILDGDIYLIEKKEKAAIDSWF